MVKTTLEHGSPSSSSIASTSLRAIRGGTGVRDDSRESIRRATVDLIYAVAEDNGIALADLECLWFTVTPDLRAEIPPLALREHGVDVPALCAVEAEWDSQPARTIRVLALARLAEEAVVHHVFRDGASRDRPPTTARGAEVEDDGPPAALAPALRERLALLLGDTPDGLEYPTLPSANVTGFPTRRSRAVLRPVTVDQVIALVRELGSADAPPLHAVSTGHNWGLGSRDAVEDGTVRLELHRLDRIRRIDIDRGWAVIEPGVTQHELAARLHGSERMLNVTASSAHTSVLGNALDRGVGLRRQRLHDLVGVEVVLPGGELVRVGWWPDGSGSAPNAAGLGPALLPLFAQSDLGIVTAGVIRLMDRPEAQYVLRLSFGGERLAPAIDTLRRWQAQGLFQGVLKVYDATSSASYGTHDEAGYRAHLSVGGTAASASALLGILVDEAERSGLFSSIARSDEAPPSAADVVARVVEAGFRGDTTVHEEMLRSAIGQDADAVDAHGGGWIFFLPLIPYTGADVVSALRLLDIVHERSGIRPGATVNALDSDVIDLVVSVRFDRDSVEEAAKAHRALDLLYESFVERGYAPYRLDIQHSAWAEHLGTRGARDLVRRIKTLIDPDRVIARGRYS